MKKIGLSFLCAFIISNLWAQEVRSGKIVYVPEFAVWGTVGDGQACAVFGLETNSETYVLTVDSVFLFGNGKFNVAEQTCSIGDSVEILGYIHSVSDDSKAFPAFETKIINILWNFSIEKVSGAYTGCLVLMPNPAYTNPCLPGLGIGLQCGGKQYILTKKGRLGDDYMEVDGVRYEEGDSVEIEGVVSTHIDLLNRTYFELEIDTIRKIEKGVDTSGNQTLPEIGEIHYDASRQNLMIESDVAIDRLEVFDAQGKCVLKANNPAGSVSVARLPHGLYLYRLTATGTTLSGKFVR